MIDDITELAQNTADAMLASGSYPKNKTFDFWRDIKRFIRGPLTKALFSGLHIGANAHVGEAGQDQAGTFHKAGPEMPSLKLRKPVAHMFHMSMIAEPKPGNVPWKAVYRVENANPQWYTKDRHGYDGIYPMNLGEMLRAKGYDVPRLPGLEWQDEIAELLCQQVLDGGDRQALWDKFYDHLLGKNQFDGHIYWALRDGLDRATIRKRLQIGLRGLMRPKSSGFAKPA